MTDYVPASCGTCKGLGAHRDPSQVGDPTADEPCAACGGSGDRLPPRLARLLASATTLGLALGYEGERVTRAWTVSSPEPSFRDVAVFVYWTPGPRGGRVAPYIYRPNAQPRSRLKRCDSLADALTWMQVIRPLDGRETRNA